MNINRERNSRNWGVPFFSARSERQSPVTTNMYTPGELRRRVNYSQRPIGRRSLQNPRNTTINNILLESYTEAAEQAEAAYKLTREPYESGLVYIIAVQDSQQRWFQSRSQVLFAKKTKIDTRLNLILALADIWLTFTLVLPIYSVISFTVKSDILKVITSLSVSFNSLMQLSSLMAASDSSIAEN
mgnify:CR=1 FL=1